MANPSKYYERLEDALVAAKEKWSRGTPDVFLGYDEHGIVAGEGGWWVEIGNILPNEPDLVLRGRDGIIVPYWVTEDDDDEVENGEK